MNTPEIIHIMKSLRDETINCPYCSRSYPKHELDCTFVDFKFMDILLEVHTNPELNPEGFKEKLYEFIKDRSEREYFLDSVCYSLTTEIVYKELGLTEEDMSYLTVRRSRFLYLWIKINILLSKKNFFKNRDSSSKEKALRSISALELLYDIKSSRIGVYTTEYDIYSQRNVIFLLKYYIEIWL